jgi:AcrR family transcriptional regulator
VLYRLLPQSNHRPSCTKGPTSLTAAPTVFSEGDTDQDVGCEDGIRHRRRGSTLERAIHDAVFTELLEVGYAGFTIESVAARAHTGKASIYRRWPTKQQLVIQAFCAKFGDSFNLLDCTIDEAVTTRDALFQVGSRMTEMLSEAGEALRATACEISRDADLAAALEEQVGCPKRQVLVALLERGVSRGEVRPEAACELFAEVLPSMITTRLIVQNRPVEDAYLTSVVDNIVMPLLRP